MSKNTDAFPNNILPYAEWNPQTGLTKREYAAIHIMAGFAADPKTDDYIIESLAEASVKWADVLFMELDK